MIQITDGVESSLRFEDGFALPLGGSLARDEIADRFPRQSSSGGGGTRFVPIAIYNKDAELVVVDLERRRLVSRTPVGIERFVFRIAERWYISDDHGITLLDGRTGFTTRLAIRGAATPVGPNAIASDVLWLWSPRRQDGLVLARIDARTLMPLDVPTPIEVQLSIGSFATREESGR